MKTRQPPASTRGLLAVVKVPVQAGRPGTRLPRRKAGKQAM